MNAVAGLGAIPMTWAVRPGRRVLAQQHRAVRPNDGVVTAFRDGQVSLRANRRVAGFTEAIQEIGYQGVEPGDLVVHAMDAFAGAVGVSDSRGKMSPVAHIYRARDRGESRYFAYVLRSMASSRYIQSLSKGIRERSTSFDGPMLAMLELPVPPPETQGWIADFLDDQINHIDQAVALRRTQMSCARERLSAAVAAKVLPRPAKQLGLSPWFANLPDGWSAAPLRSGWQVIDCKHRTPHYVAEGYPVISPGDVSPGRLDIGRAHRFVDEVDFADLADPLRRCRPGDLVYSRNASAGTAAYVEAHEPFTMGQDVCRITSLHNSQLYLMYVLNYLVTPQLDAARIGSTFTRINVDRIKSLRLPVPPPQEQRDIADSCDRISAMIGDVVSQVELAIDLLQERKRALIMAAVTGEFDVSTASMRAAAAVIG